MAVENAAAQTKAHPLRDVGRWPSTSAYALSGVDAGILAESDVDEEVCRQNKTVEPVLFVEYMCENGRRRAR